MVFFEAVDKAILEDGFVVTTVRYANCGGAKTYHLYKETAAFVKDLNEYRPKTSITVHTAKCFDYIGPSNEHAHSIAADRLKRAHKDDNDDGIDLILINSEQNELDDSHYQFIDNHEDLQAWFERSQGQQVAFGQMIFWEDNSPIVFTGYVPDKDGIIRTGAY